MTLRIMHNSMAITAHRMLTGSDAGVERSLERLSSGYRINRAADDAAGLAKSEKLRADVRGLDQARRNTQDAISFVQIAEGALEDVHAMLQRINELAVAAANIASSDGRAEQAEVTELLEQIDKAGGSTTFAGMAVFGNGAVTFQVGAESGDSITMSTPAVTSAAIGDGVGPAVDLTAIDLTTDAADAIATVRQAIDNITGLRAFIGAQQNRLQHTLNAQSYTFENLTASESRIRDLDIAAESVTLTRHQIMSQAGTAMLAQANTAPRQVLTLLNA